MKATMRVPQTKGVRSGPRALGKGCRQPNAGRHAGRRWDDSGRGTGPREWNPRTRRSLREAGLVDEFALSYSARFESLPEQLIYCEHGNQFDPTNTLVDQANPLDTPVGTHIVTELVRPIGAGVAITHSVDLRDLSYVFPLAAIPEWIVGRIFYPFLGQMLRWLLPALIVTHIVYERLTDILRPAGEAPPGLGSVLLEVAYFLGVLVVASAVVFLISRRTARHAMSILASHFRGKVPGPEQYREDVAIRELLKNDRPPPMAGNLSRLEIAVFISGHTHAPAISALTRADGRETVIVNTGCWLRQLQPVTARLGAPTVFVPAYVHTHVRVRPSPDGVTVELWDHPKPAQRRLPLIERAAIAGRMPSQFGVAQKPCTFTGECDIGCNQGAKNTLDLNYLALAEQHGATVGTLSEAVSIARAGDGYQVRLREYGHPGAGRDGVERHVTARYVFVCAGALGTTELLLRSRDRYRTLPDLPPALGHGYSGNGDFLSFGDGLREPAEPSNGPTITTAALMHTGTATDEQWFVLEEGGYSEHLAKLIRGLHVSRLPAYAARLVGTSTRRVLGTARDLGAALDDGAARTAVLLAMGRDRADGRIELRGPGHRLHVTWDVTRNDPLYDAERAVSGQVVRALGGRPFGTPTWRLFRQPVTVHNLGGARMGIDPETAVVDTDGEVFGHTGLYVLDGAALPGATGANPSSTIAAVAERCIEVAVRRITGKRDWVAPQRAEVVPPDLPEDRAVRAVVAQGGPRRTGPGLAFRETMRGSAGVPTDPAGRRRRIVLRLGVDVPDLQTFLDDPVHAGFFAGRVLRAFLPSAPTRRQDQNGLHTPGPGAGAD